MDGVEPRDGVERVFPSCHAAPARVLQAQMRSRRGATRHVVHPCRAHRDAADGSRLVTHLLCQERLSQDWAALQQLMPALRSHPLPAVPQRPSNRSLEAGAVSAATRALLYSEALYAEDLLLWAAVCNRSSLGGSPGDAGGRTIGTRGPLLYLLYLLLGAGLGAVGATAGFASRAGGRRRQWRRCAPRLSAPEEHLEGQHDGYDLRVNEAAMEVRMPGHGELSVGGY